MGQDLKTSVDIISVTTTNSLALADTHALQSIAFPAIGTGVGGLSVEACARAMLTASIDYLAKQSQLKLVRFVLFDQAGEEAFAKQLRAQFTK